MKLFADPTKLLTATIEEDTDNDLWPEFKVHFKPAVEFEVAAAISGGHEGKMQFLRDKIKSWEGLVADGETAGYLNSTYGQQLKKTISAGDQIPYHECLLATIHSVCINIIWTKVAGFARLSSREPTGREVLEKTAKN